MNPLPVLGSDGVHIWRAWLDRPAEQISHLQETLDEDEQARAKRMYFQKDRERFIAARGLLKVILGAYLRLKPSQLLFGYGPQGKPALASPANVQGVRFNLSAAQGLALVAIARERDVGVDLEGARPNLIDDAMIERCCSPQELARIRVLPPSRQPKAFLVSWTRKEAYLKARGEGLAIAPERVDVSSDLGTLVDPSGVNGAAQDTARWSLRTFYPASGYVAALAVEGQNVGLQCWPWED